MRKVWLALVGLVGSIMLVLGYIDYTIMQCKIALSETTRSAWEIQDLCEE